MLPHCCYTSQESNSHTQNQWNGEQEFIYGIHRQKCKKIAEHTKLLCHVTQCIIIDIINDVSKNYNITKENKIFIANFYKYGFAGVIENWIVTEMKESPENIIKKLDILISGNFEEAIRKMSE